MDVEEEGSEENMGQFSKYRKDKHELFRMHELIARKKLGIKGIMERQILMDSHQTKEKLKEFLLTYDESYSRRGNEKYVKELRKIYSEKCDELEKDEIIESLELCLKYYETYVVSIFRLKLTEIDTIALAGVLILMSLWLFSKIG